MFKFGLIHIEPTLALHFRHLQRPHIPGRSEDCGGQLLALISSNIVRWYLLTIELPELVTRTISDKKPAGAKYANSFAVSKFDPTKVSDMDPLSFFP